MKPNPWNRQVVVLVLAMLALIAVVAVAYTRIGGAQPDPAQKFRGNFGVALTEVPAQDRAFLEMVMATEVAAMTQIPTANPFAPTPVYPTAPPRPTGIMGGIPILPGEFYYITNMWQGRIGASYVQVICVTEQQDRSQGMLYVRTLSDAGLGSSKAPQQGPIWYKLPAKVGPVEVTAENGLVLTLSAVKDPATKFIFDVGQRTWVFPLGQPPIPAVPATPPLPHP